MSRHQPRLSRCCPVVFPFGDLHVRSTDSGGTDFNQDRALAQIGFGKIFVPDYPGLDDGSFPNRFAIERTAEPPMNMIRPTKKSFMPSRMPIAHTPESGN